MSWLVVPITGLCAWFLASKWLTWIFEKSSKLEILRNFATSLLQLPDVSGFAQLWVYGLGVVGSSIGLMSALMYFHWGALQKRWVIEEQEKKAKGWKKMLRVVFDMHLLVIIFCPLISLMSFLLNPRFGSVLLGFVYAFAAAGVVCLCALVGRAMSGGLKGWPVWLLTIVVVVSWRWILLSIELMQG